MREQHKKGSANDSSPSNDCPAGAAAFTRTLSRLMHGSKHHRLTQRKARRSAFAGHSPPTSSPKCAFSVRPQQPSTSSSCASIWNLPRPHYTSKKCHYLPPLSGG